MSNGGGPPPLPLSAINYSIIKTGDCITGGPYNGCIKVGTTYYRLERGEEEWEVETGASRSMVKMTDDVWDCCKDGGTYTYDQELQGWRDSGQQGYRWAGAAGDKIELEEV